MTLLTANSQKRPVSIFARAFYFADVCAYARPAEPHVDRRSANFQRVCAIVTLRLSELYFSARAFDRPLFLRRRPALQSPCTLPTPRFF